MTQGKLPVGTRIKVTGGVNRGKTGTITEPSPFQYAGEYTFARDDQTGNGKWFAKHDEVEPLARFAVGDEVVYKLKPNGYWAGIVVTDIEYNEDGTVLKYYCETPSGADGAFYDAWLDPKPEPAKPQPKYAVGDRLTYTKGTGYWGDVTVTEIIRDYFSSGEIGYRAERSDGVTGVFREACVVPFVEPEPEPEPIFTEGQVVVLVDARWLGAKKGALAVVSQDYYEADEYLKVTWLKSTGSDGQRDGEYYAKNFAAYDPAKQFAVEISEQVAAIDNSLLALDEAVQALRDHYAAAGVQA